MNNNIFEGAKFGDKFVTRGRGKCLIVEPPYKLTIDGEYKIDYIVRGEPEVVSCDINGYVTDGDSDWDIVSRYQEPIDEDKLDELAKEYANEKWSNEWPYIPYESGEEEPDVIKDFKVGYRKAKEEKYDMDY